MLDHEPQRFELLVRVGDLVGLAVQDHAAVVHRVVERGAREHERVDVRDGHARVVAGLEQRVQHAVRARAVQVQPVAAARVDRRDHAGLPVVRERDVAQEALVEDRVHDRAVVAAALRAALQSGAWGGDELGHG